MFGFGDVVAVTFFSAAFHKRANLGIRKGMRRRWFEKVASRSAKKFLPGGLGKVVFRSVKGCRFSRIFRGAKGNFPKKHFCLFANAYFGILVCMT